MARKSVEGMRQYWDDAAKRNAAWYVDTSLDFNDPDMDRFLATGRQIVHDLLDEAPVQPAGNALAVDIGCGLGRICLALAERFDKVVGIDISSEMLDQARTLLGDRPIELLLGDGATLQPIEDGVADAVVSFTVLQHIPDQAVIEGYLRESARILKPGGLLAAQWNGSDGATSWRMRRAVLSLLQRTGLKVETHRRNAPEFMGTRVPAERIRAVLEDAGMHVEDIRGAGSLYAWVWATKR